MMKNKALTYVLLIVVGIVWYQVFFRVKDNLMGEETEIPSPNQTLASVSIMARDTVDLNVDYRDPFRYKKQARAVTTGVSPNTNQRNVRPVQARPRKPDFAWPNVTYHGLIRNRSSQHPLALIRVDGLVYNLRKGEEIYNGIIVKNITADMVTLISGKHKIDVAVK